MLQTETYNKLFTMHGIVMIFFFLVPSIPSVLGNFLLPLMIGARDVAFPRLNLASWYIYIIGGLFTLYAIICGRRRHGLDFLRAVQHRLLQHARHGRRRRRFHHRLLVDFDRA